MHSWSRETRTRLVLSLLGCLGATAGALSAPAPPARHPPLPYTFTGHTKCVFSVAFDAHGRTIASGSSDKTVKLWDVKTGNVKGTLEGHASGLYSLSYSPDGKTLASGSDDRTIKLWDAKTGKERTTLRGHVKSVMSVAYSPNGRTLVSGSYDKSCKLWAVPPADTLGE